MPRGTRHEITGILLEQRGELVLDVADGGTWQLDAGWRVRRLLGMRVKVIGIRDDFDLLAVEHLNACSEAGDTPKGAFGRTRIRYPDVYGHASSRRS